MFATWGALEAPVFAPRKIPPGFRLFMSIKKCTSAAILKYRSDEKVLDILPGKDGFLELLKMFATWGALEAPVFAPRKIPPGFTLFMSIKKCTSAAILQYRSDEKVLDILPEQGFDGNSDSGENSDEDPRCVRLLMVKFGRNQAGGILYER